jgi:hypothetical protein
MILRIWRNSNFSAYEDLLGWLYGLISMPGIHFKSVWDSSKLIFLIREPN